MGTGPRAAGGVGSLFVQLARARGARVVASASAPCRELLDALGVEVFLDRHAGDVPGRPGRRSAGAGRRLELAIDRNVDLHGVLVRPSRELLDARPPPSPGGCDR
jgi:NADPH:quinone reductase-like Zn-dependent oxidoreductase